MKTIISISIVTYLILLVASGLHAEMLNPYQPPPPQSKENWRQSPQQQVVPRDSIPKNRRIDESIYNKFRNETAGINQAERKRLKKEFTNKVNKAKKNPDEATYYRKLIRILEEGEK